MSVTNTDNRPTVAVYGSSVTGQDEPAYAQAVEAGRLLAMAGARLACGGYGGVMEAVSRGASEAGGEVVGGRAALVGDIAALVLVFAVCTLIASRVFRW